jgi:glycosyltransferase involved in cell wall biosynthesis
MYNIENKRKPLVSIGMPVLNGGKFLRESLDCLLNQTYSNFELIFSDNGSTDDSKEIILEYSSRDKRIIPKFQKTNIGPINNFQFVLKEAVGEYFMWAAHDDKWDSNYLDELVKTHQKHSNLSLVFGKYSMMNEEGKVFQKGRNNLFKHKRLTVDYRNPLILNAIIYYLDRNPMKIYGLFRTIDLKNTPQQLFLGSPQNSENLLLTHFLSNYKACETFNTTFYYRVPYNPKNPKQIAEDSNYKIPSRFKIEKHFLLETINFLYKKNNVVKYLHILLLLISFPIALLKPLILKFYYALKGREINILP